jgi:diguanylate cyclase (GGDEF)-like protein/PAS domain S-box-containing protein
VIASKPKDGAEARTTVQSFEAAVLDEVSEAVVALRLDGTVAFHNHAARSLFGLSLELMTGTPLFELQGLSDSWRSSLRRGIDRARASEPLMVRSAHVRRDGSRVVTEQAFRPHRDASGTVDGVVLVIRDVTYEVTANKLLARRAAQQHALAELSTAALATSDLVQLSRRAVEVLAEVLDADHVWVDALQGSSYARLGATGSGPALPRAAMSLSSLAELEERDGYDATVIEDLSALEGAETEALTGSLMALPIRLGATRGLVAVHYGKAFAFAATDVAFLRAVGNVLSTAAERIDREEHIHYSALHDALTGLPNRTLLMDRIEHACGRVAAARETVVVLVFDLDHYTLVNDALGRSGGDRLLKLLVNHLMERLSERHTLARLGGDTFALLAECPGDAFAGAVGLADHILRVVAEPLTLEGTNHYLSVAIGIAVHQGDRSSTELLRNADAAMYVAKQHGGARYQIFDDTLLDRAVERLTMTNDLREAVEAEELVLHYQPQIDLQTGAVIDLEALIRWDHPRMGRLMPDDFLGVAEATGNMEAIGRWVVSQALDDLGSWSDDSRLAGVGISINLSVGELLSEDFNSELGALLQDPDIDPRRVTFEITESAAMDDPEIAIKALTRLRELGARIAVDDFGTGYSSMVYLRRLPIDVLKIDREFTDGVATEGSDDSAIVEATIGLGRALRLQCVAEGVETAAQESALRRLGCERAQGWRYAKALPLEEALEMARRSQGGALVPNGSPVPR